MQENTILHDPDLIQDKRNVPIKKVLLTGIFLFLLYLIILYKLYFLFNSRFHLLIEAYTIFTGLFLLSRLIIAFFYEDDHSKFSKKQKKYPSVSFVIACKNEEDSIEKTIDYCLASKYEGAMECIVVNDGSTDNTLEAMQRSKKKYGEKLTIIDFGKENRGKREGMAEGVLAANGEYIVFVDSDSFVKPDAVTHAIDHFLHDPKLGALSGNTLVHNHSTNTLTKMQAVRYGIAFDIFKACESVYGAVTCCPGCFSVYRKDAVLNVLDKWRNQMFLGTRSTFGDDRSLTNYVLKDWKIIYCRKALASTIVPEHYRKFFKQQLRWKKSWMREGTNAAKFMWKKNVLASLSFYTNLLIPIAGPFIVARVFVYDVLIKGETPWFFVGGVLAMALVFGIYYYLIFPNKYWWRILQFSALYTFVLVWQMPYAILKLRDTSWGTR